MLRYLPGPPQSGPTGRDTRAESPPFRKGGMRNHRGTNRNRKQVEIQRPPVKPCVRQDTLHKGLPVRFATRPLAPYRCGCTKNPHVRHLFISHPLTGRNIFQAPSKGVTAKLPAVPALLPLSRSPCPSGFSPGRLAIRTGKGGTAELVQRQIPRSPFHPRIAGRMPATRAISNAFGLQGGHHPK